MAIILEKNEFFELLLQNSEKEFDGTTSGIKERTIADATFAMIQEARKASTQFANIRRKEEMDPLDKDALNLATEVLSEMEEEANKSAKMVFSIAIDLCRTRNFLKKKDYSIEAARNLVFEFRKAIGQAANWNYR